MPMSNEDTFAEYAILDAEIKVLEEKKKKMRKDILNHIIDSGEKVVKMPFGNFTYSERKSYSYSPEITEMEEQLEGLKAKAQETGDAEFTVTSSFTFTPINI